MLPFADTAAMNAHLAEIARTVAPGAHALLILDGAGWLGGKALAVPDIVSLLTLPPYAPELNPVENVWQYLRGLEPLRRRSRRHHLDHLTPLGTGQLRGPLVSLVDFGAHHRKGPPISTSRAEGCDDDIANALMGERRRMRWSPRSAHRDAVARAASLDGRLTISHRTLAA